MSRWDEWFEQVALVCEEKEEQLRNKSFAFSAQGKKEEARKLDCLYQRLGKALTVVMARQVTYQGKGVFHVRSRSENTHRTVTRGKCDCPANKFKIQCTHRLAAYLYYEGSLRHHDLKIKQSMGILAEKNWLQKLKAAKSKEEIIEVRLLASSYQLTGQEGELFHAACCEAECRLAG
jgi:hypothetical protein